MAVPKVFGIRAEVGELPGDVSSSPVSDDVPWLTPAFPRGATYQRQKRQPFETENEARYSAARRKPCHGTV